MSPQGPIQLRRGTPEAVAALQHARALVTARSIAHETNDFSLVEDLLNEMVNCEPQGIALRFEALSWLTVLASVYMRAAPDALGAVSRDQALAWVISHRDPTYEPDAPPT